MIWADAVGYEGLYQVSNNGDIFSIKSNKILKQSHKGRYKKVNLCKNGVVTT